MEEEIVKINRKLKNMIEKSNVDKTVTHDLLIRIQELNITLMVLHRTGIGKTVNELRRVNISEDLSEMAKNLMKTWKKLLPESVVATPSLKDEKESKPSTNQPPKKNSTNKTHRQQASTTTEGDDTVRLKSRELLANALTITGLPEGSHDPIELSARIEDAIFTEIKGTTVKYGRRIRSRIFNLRDLKNPDLRSRVLLGSITPEQLAGMTSEDMTSDTLKEECAKFKEIAHRQSQLAVDDEVGSDLIQCERCKKSNVSYSELQTLSGDEPMTLFVLCKNCGYRWRG